MASQHIFLWPAAVSVLIFAPYVTATCTTDLAKVEPGLEIRENTMADTPILNVTNSGELEELVSHELLKVMSGSVYTKVNINLDGSSSLCKPYPSYTIRCKNDQNSEKQLFLIITYTDDFLPGIQSPLEISVKESTSANSTVEDLSTFSTDKDCETPETFHYEVLPSDSSDSASFFTVNGNKLILAKELDYEQETDLWFNVTVATSVLNVQNYKTSTSLVHVTVVDVDDRDPEFHASSFSLHVFEEVDHSRQWLTASPAVKAVDGDTAINTTLVYSVTEVKPTMNLMMNNQTGEIQILSVLDREKTSSYTVIVRAAQENKPYMSATATVTIFVDDANDNIPQFTSQSSDVTVREDIGTGTYVLAFHATDADEGVYAQFDYVLSDNGLGAFEVTTDPVTNQTWLTVADNQPLRSRTQVIVQVKLNESIPSSGPQTCDYVTTCVKKITVHIDDVNDNSPVFTQKSYDFSIFNNQSAGHVIGKVEATDADRRDNARITYKLDVITSSTTCKTLGIDTSGSITLKQQAIDLTECVSIVMACDNPIDISLRRCTSVPVSATIYHGGAAVMLNIDIPENVPTGSAVMALPGKDLHTNSLDFEVRDGVLYTNISLDRETKETHQVVVLNGNQMTAIITVNVEDMNDNPPKFGHEKYVINIDGDANIGDLLLQVNATDVDKGKNSALTFSLLSGSQWFSLDHNTGEIRLTNFMSENNTVYQLVVQDSGDPVLQDLASLRVYSPVYEETAFVLLPVTRDHAMNDRQGVARKLSDILGVTVKILNIESLATVEEMGSKLYITATSSNGNKITPSKLNELLDERATDIHAAFLKSTDDDDGDFTLPVIILICVAGVLLLSLVVTMAMLCRKHRKFKQSLRLLNDLNRDTTIYDSTRKPSTSSLAILTNGSNNNNIFGGMITAARLSNGSIHGGSVRRDTAASLTHGVENPAYTHDEDATSVIIQNGSVGRRTGEINSTDTDQPDGVVVAPATVKNHGDGVDENGDVTTQNPGEVRITRFGSQIDEVKTITSPVHITTIDVRPYPRDAPGDGADPVLQPHRPARPVEGTPLLDRRNSIRSSEADSGLPNDNNADDIEDINDKEVANILTDANHLATSSNNQSDMPSDSNAYANLSNLDLMTTKSHPQASVVTVVHNPDPDYMSVISPDTNPDHGNEIAPEEQEPDYAKRVRFNDISAEVIVEPDSGMRAEESRGSDDVDEAARGGGMGEGLGGSVSSTRSGSPSSTSAESNHFFLTPQEMTQF